MVDTPTLHCYTPDDCGMIVCMRRDGAPVPGAAGAVGGTASDGSIAAPAVGADGAVPAPAVESSYEGSWV